MARIPNIQSKHNGPPEHEWLFADRELLPDDETVAAYYWEFGLETADVVEEVEAVRRRVALKEKVDPAAVKKWCSENPRPEDCQRWEEWGNKFQEQFPDYIVTSKFYDLQAGFLSSWPEFPKQHWLKISKVVRQDKKRIRPSANSPISVVDAICDPHLWSKWGEIQKFDTVPSFFYKTKLGLACHTWIQSTQLYGESNTLWYNNWSDTRKSPWGVASPDRWEEYRLVRVHWERSDRKLKADFAEWLKENRPDDRQSYHKSKASDSHRTTERDSLKALGAFRLLRHFKGDWKAAADYSELYCKDRRGNPKPLYVEQSEWRHAEKKAAIALTKFHSKVFTKKVFG